MTMAHSPLRTEVLVEQYVKKSPLLEIGISRFFFIWLSGCAGLRGGCQAPPLNIWNLMKYIWRGMHVESHKWRVNTLPLPWNEFIPSPLFNCFLRACCMWWVKLGSDDYHTFSQCGQMCGLVSCLVCWKQIFLPERLFTSVDAVLSSVWKQVPLWEHRTHGPVLSILPLRGL
jgi:hypothetical protein